MHHWPALVKVALLGADRHRDRPPAQGELDALFAAIYARNDGEPERALLDALAAAALYQRCGALPGKAAQPLPEPAAAESRPEVGATAHRHLRLILGDERFAGQLPEWLAAVNGTGKRLPEDALPALLERGAKRKELRVAIGAVAGERGRWLAPFRPEWRYLFNSGDEALPLSIWEEGSLDMRVPFLSALRERDPARARSLLESVWKQEPARHRVQLLAALATNLDDTDQPFLESLLDDKSKEVRQQAAALLCRLPASSLSHRMRERAASVITVRAKSGLLSKLVPGVETIVLALPEDIPAEWERDGISEKPPAAKGKKAWWLEQLLALVPPQHFTANGALAPAEIVAAAARHEWSQPLLLGWRAAAANHRDAAWAEALLAHEPFVFAELWPVLPPDRRDALFLDLLQRDPVRHMPLLTHLGGGWSVPFSREVIRAWRGMSDATIEIADYSIYGPLRSAAACLAPELCDEGTALLRPHLEGGTRWTKIFTEVFEVVRFRADMLKAIAE